MSFQKNAFVLALASLIWPAFSHAQTTGVAASASPNLQPILVYASRFEEKEEATLPQTMVISSSEILSSGASNVSEVLSKIVGLPTSINLDGSTNAVVDMRGYGDTASNNVVVLLDGVRISEVEQTTAKTSMIPIEMIDHIEVTYGGNSVLYGDGATGGTINIVTKKAIGELTVVSGGVSSYAGFQSNLFHARTLGSSQLSVFARGLNSNGYRDGSSTRERSAGLNWTTDIDASTTAGIRLLSSRDKNTLPGPLPSIYLETKPTLSEVPGYHYGSYTQTNSATLFGNKKIDRVELMIDVARLEKSSDSDYRYNAIDVYTGYSPTLSPSPPINTFAYGTTGIKGYMQSFNPRLKVTDFGLSGNALIMGVDRLSSGRNMQASLTNAYNPDAMSNSTSQVHHRTQAFYVSDDWKISSFDRVTVGYRSQSYSESNAGTSNWLSFGSASAHEVQYTRTINPNLIGYVKSGQNFRLPNVDDNNSVNYDANNNPIMLMPQVSHDVDMGLVYKGSRWRSEIRVFTSDIRHEIAFDPGVNWGYGGNINYDPTKRVGFNLRQSYQIDKDWDVRLNLHHVKATFTEGTYVNNLVPNTARNNGNIQLGYQIADAHKMTLSARFSSDKFASGDFLNTQSKVPGYIVEDLGYMYKIKSFSLTGSINNIFNKHYTDLGIYKPYNSGDGYYYIAPYNMTVYPNPGRSFSVVGRYNF